ncbi:putative GCR1-dependent translation factor 1 [Sclerotinia borealis F-4128]|uniref:Putative GCR1-dependent translation factor 1 n=1 Tax=Sclerotinia borealis (strain F-4128) TaxID=1432307 RepID=W9CEC2_SCLBF|nr:putative GCR1-dependent translation factor 1 [Sclerotinia borealis F-4128]
MRFRRKQSPLLLLLLPSLALALSPAAQDNIQSTLSKDTDAQTGKTDKNVDSGYDASSAVAGIADNKAKYDVGTKDAPVDGKDGKPHAGPFVDNTKKDPKSDATTDDKTDTKDLKESKDSNSKLEDGELVVPPIAKPSTPKEEIMLAADGTKIPQSNNGVMNDPGRELPKHGTTGTEGGVSEKEKTRKGQESQTGEKVEKKPASPKEAPPIPHDTEQKLQIETKDSLKKDSTTKKDVDGKETDGVDNLAGLDKPTDLPDKTNNAPHPIPNSANKDHLDLTKPDSKAIPKLELEGEGNDGLIQPLHSYLLSLAMILCSEIGDKTFLIAALMAMKHDRLLVFSAAFSALIAMTILSAVLGHAVPTLIPKRFTNFLASGLFLIFGGRLLREGLAMSPDEGVGEEMKEVEMELEEKEHLAKQQGRRRSSVSPYALEMGLGGGQRASTRKSRSGSRLPSPPRSPSSSPDRSPSPKRSTLKGVAGGLNNLLSLLLSPAWVQTFVMTFLGEWGDRSQIATIAMAAGQDYWWVTGGAVSGHAVCTGVAVIGGRAIAGKVSLRVVTLGGAIAFLIFGVIYLVEALYYA